MSAVFLSIPFLLIVALIFRAQGSFNVFALWNCVPVAGAFIAMSSGLPARTPRAAGVIAFSVVSAVLPALFHLAWLFDWRGTATGSSNSALAFIFVPIWAGVIATVAGIVAWGIARCLRHPTVTTQ